LKSGKTQAKQGETALPPKAIKTTRKEHKKNLEIPPNHFILAREINERKNKREYGL